MRIGKRELVVILVILAAATAILFLGTPVRMQFIEKQKTLMKLDQPRLVVRKEARVLELYDGSRLVKTYSVVLGFAPEGDKEKEGDGKTPEGEFYVFTKNAKSQFHLSLGISYPAKDDAIRGLQSGVISKTEHDDIAKAIDSRKMPPQKTALGGEIYIHGGGTASDWTWGCVAMNNQEIEELFEAVPVGTRVEIRP
jgi:murein L,D-transpeptidase YafK